MPRVGWLAVVLMATGIAAPAAAQPLGPVAPVGSPPLGSTPVTPRRPAEQLPPILGAPVSVSSTPVTPAGYADTPSVRKPQRAAALGVPSTANPVDPLTPASANAVSATMVETAVAQTAYQSPDKDTVGDFLTKRSDLKERDPSSSSSWFPKMNLFTSKSDEMGGGGGGWFEGVFGTQNGAWFRSDHTFDGFISPVSNPFLFEDPRSLTELRPIFIYQAIPSRQADFHGGHVSFLGLQGRVAITDRWSLVFNKFGGIWLNSNSPSPFRDASSFAELWLSPKFTFYRGEDTGTLAAAGLQFQIPTGSQSTFQNTGTLSLVPYVSFAQNFLRDFRAGSFNVMANTGYSFSTNQQRSDYYYLSAHLDFDIANLHKFYPLFEMNWFLYTTNGNSTPIGSEGRDLINFGGHSSGTGLLTGAFGGRVKITESAQVGAAFEIPFAGRRDLFSYRFTIDFILRY